VVTLEALAPFRTAFIRPAIEGGDPGTLPYLDGDDNRLSGAFDLTLEVELQTAAMRAAGLAPQRLSRGRWTEAAWWTLAQLVTHHTVGGCNLQPGDLLGTGTLSGPGPDQAGSLLELSGGGKSPLTLPGGETRTFLQDGDTLTLKAWGEKPGARRIGLGSCSGTVQRWLAPPGLRVEHALCDGAAVPPFYDSMMAKLVAHGPARQDAEIYSMVAK
jgi:fumarylacetoacetase